MFPIKGKPLGPGGYGNLDLLRDLMYPASVMRETVTATGTAKLASIFASSSMVRRTG